MEYFNEFWHSFYDASGVAYGYAEYMLIALAIILLFLIAIVGCVIPVIPGPTLAFIAVLIWKFALAGDRISYICLGFCLVLTIFAQLLDWWLPIKYTPTKRGAWGAFAGVFAGTFLSIFFPPIAIFAIFLSPLAGAFLFEYMGNPDFNKAWKSGKGAFIGTLLTVVAKAFVIFLIILAASLDFVF